MGLTYLYFSNPLWKILEQQEQLMIYHAAANTKSVRELPESYTEVPPFTATTKNPQVSATNINIQPDGSSYNRDLKDEVRWIENSSKVIWNQEPK